MNIFEIIDKGLEEIHSPSNNEVEVVITQLRKTIISAYNYISPIVKKEKRNRATVRTLINIQKIKDIEYLDGIEELARNLVNELEAYS